MHKFGRIKLVTLFILAWGWSASGAPPIGQATSAPISSSISSIRSISSIVSTPAHSDGPIGSGDGRIHVIPALSAPSIKNGGKLTIQAVVKAEAGVAKVEAVIEGVETIQLKPGQLAGAGGINSAGGLKPGATMGLYQAEWKAKGLEEKIYPVALRVTDLRGHTYTDHSLSFSDPAAGNSTPGTTAYPSGGMRRTGMLMLSSVENGLESAVIDPAGGFVYFGTASEPGVVVKVRLSDFTRVGVLTLNSGENNFRCAAIDPTGGFAYFGACPYSNG
jgi:hypothetical protein